MPQTYRSAAFLSNWLYHQNEKPENLDLQEFSGLKSVKKAGIIPTRRIKSFSKHFCLGIIIRSGFIWYRLFLPYCLYRILLSKIYHRNISIGYTWCTDTSGLDVL